MRKVVMYPHGGSGNHGCEAIVRASIKILEAHGIKEKPYLFTSRMEQDIASGLDKKCILNTEIEPISKRSAAYLKAALKYRIGNEKEAFEVLSYRKFLDTAAGSVALSIGGDNYCYGEPEHIYFMNRQAKAKGAKTILWGCSVEPDSISEAMKADIAAYDAITARESITYEALSKINPNTRLYPDPAFLLDTVFRPLPRKFQEGNMVGINVSPMVMKNEKVKGMVLNSYCKLIDYILEETDMGIALIPHVYWSHNDDRIPLRQLYETYYHTGKVVLLEEHNSMELKGYVARCRFFVGARTHASIAAYSSCVPTLVVGYSVKARGIARDLFGTEEGYVQPVQSMELTEQLRNAFIRIQEEELQIRGHLKKRMPEYCARALEAGKEIKKLLG